MLVVVVNGQDQRPRGARGVVRGQAAACLFHGVYTKSESPMQMMSRGGASYANHDRRRGVSSRSSSSSHRQATSSRRVYERYDVNIPGIIGNTYSIEEARMRRNQRLLLYLVAMLIFVISWVTFLSDDTTTNTSCLADPKCPKQVI